jgi:hypothetical protein
MLERNLARWLEPAGVQLDNERIPIYLEAVREMSGDLTGRELNVVHAAHSDLDDAIRSWIGTVVRTHDQGFVAEGKDELLARLACGAVINALASSMGRSAILANLAVESASFLGLTPVIHDIKAVSAHQLLESGKRVRARVELDGFALASVGKVPAERKADPETGAAVTADQVAEDVFAQAKAIRALASGIDSRMNAYAQRQSALDEEIEILWWILRGRDDDGMSWTEHPPVRRAALLAEELKERTLRLPGPPAAGHLLARALQDSADATVSIADLAEAGAQITTLPSGTDKLLPITSTIGAYREVNGNDDLWRGLAETKFGIPVNLETTLATAAEQLYRELEMMELLEA